MCNFLELGISVKNTWCSIQTQGPGHTGQKAGTIVPCTLAEGFHKRIREKAVRYGSSHSLEG